MPIGYIVDIEFLWGFQANIIGLSKTPPSFYYPPPTTILGAIAEALAKEHKLGENKGKELIPAISKNVLALGVRPLNCFPIKYEDINRLITIRRVGVKDRATGRNIGITAPHPKYLEKSFDAPARGKTALISLDNESPKIRLFIVLKSGNIRLGNENIVLDGNHLWRIHRLGSKESRVSIINVVEVKEFLVRENSGVTNYSFPLVEGVLPTYVLEGSWEYEVYVNPFNLKSYFGITEYILGRNSLPFMVPLKKTVLEEPKYRVTLAKGLVVYKAFNEAIVGYG